MKESLAALVHAHCVSMKAFLRDRHACGASYSPAWGLELELLSAVWGAAHKSASLVRGPVRGHHGVSLGGGLSR